MVDILPVDKTQTYWFALLTKADFDAFASEDELMAADLDYLETVASQYGKTLGELLSEELFSGDKEWSYLGLSPQTTYCFYAYGLSSEAVATTGINRIEFTTPKVEPVDCTFTLEPSEITTSSFKLTVTPSDALCAYYFDVFTADMWQNMCGGDPRRLPAFLEQYVAEAAVEYGLTVPEAVARLSSFGPQTETFSYLDPGTPYYTFAIGIGADGTATTPAVVAQVKTAAAPTNEFGIEQVAVGFDTATFRILPSQEESYVALCELQEYFEGMTDAQMIDEVIRAYGDDLRNRVFAGSETVSEEMLVPDKPYYLLVFGYSYGEVTTPLTKYAFTTQKAGTVDCSFEITVRNVKKTTADVRITPSNDKASFFFNAITASEYASLGGDQAAIHTYSDGIIDALVAQSTMPRYEWLSRALEHGIISWALDDLTAGTQYYVFAVGMAADGTFTTPVFMSDPFTTEAEGQSVARIKFIPVVSDGGSYGHAGEALVYGWFYPTSADYMLLNRWVGDDTCYKKSDAEVLAYLAANGERYADSVVSVFDFVPYGQTVYYLAAAYDTDGLPVISRESVTPEDPSAPAVCRPSKFYRRYEVSQPGLWRHSSPQPVALPAFGAVLRNQVWRTTAPCPLHTARPIR